MDVNNIVVCDMQLDQVPAIAVVHMKAFPGYMNTSLGGFYLRNFIKWFCETKTSIAICAMDSNRIVGYAVGAPQGYSKEVTRSIFWIAAISLLVRPWLWFSPRIIRSLAIRLGFVGEHVSLKMPELNQPIYSLVGVGVLPEYRGKKVGLRLLKAFEDRAIQNQSKSLMLTVYRDNDARSFYERNGWVLHDASPNTSTVMYYKIIS